MTRYKVLVDGKSCCGGEMSWSLPRQVGESWIPGEWHEVEGELYLCENGLHLTTDPVKWLHPFCDVYEAEPDDPAQWHMTSQDKSVHRKVRLLRLDSDYWLPRCWRDSDRFIAGLADIPFLSATEPGEETVYDPAVHTSIDLNREREHHDINRWLESGPDKHHYSLWESVMLIQARIRGAVAARSLSQMYVNQLLDDATAFWSTHIVCSMIGTPPDDLLAKSRARWTAWCNGYSLVGGTDPCDVIYDPPYPKTGPPMPWQSAQLWA